MTGHLVKTLIDSLGSMANAKRYAENIARMNGDNAAEYAKAAEDIDLMIKEEFEKRVKILNEIAKLPGYHPVDGDLGSVPL